ncbi:MAG: icfA [Gammaproteobacteria bacterium]|jgi:carbonic anhydrase|nr:icfA [Gammaproteobacteria bacterium]
MENSLKKILNGYHIFREKYAKGDLSVMRYLSRYGQNPQIMVVACCDSRVDPALILQCDPGDLFVVRNVANIVPPYERDEAHHGTSAALEFGVCFLKVKHLILLGHSQCGGIQALMSNSSIGKNDFISNWVNLIHSGEGTSCHVDDCAKQALQQSYRNCLTFPWIKDKIEKQELALHLWFFDIESGQIFMYSQEDKSYKALPN